MANVNSRSGLELRVSSFDYARQYGFPDQKGPVLGRSKVSGGDIEEATPDPIPNSEVKLFGADGTARAT